MVLGLSHKTVLVESNWTRFLHQSTPEICDFMSQKQAQVQFIKKQWNLKLKPGQPGGESQGNQVPVQEEERIESRLNPDPRGFKSKSHRSWT